MLDGLILRLLSMGERFDLPAVVMTIDELQTLQKLPQLMPLGQFVHCSQCQEPSHKGANHPFSGSGIPHFQIIFLLAEKAS